MTGQVLMTLDETIRNMVHYYPGLHYSRIAALDHLFCVGGSGYRWRRGVLKPFRLEREEPMDRLLAEQDRMNRMTDWEKSMMASWFKEEAEKIKYVHQHEQAIIAGTMHYSLMGWRGFFPMSPWHDGILCRVPADVRSSWLAGAVEVAELILDFDTNFGMAYVGEDRERHRTEAMLNAEIARRALDDLRGRFPGCTAPTGLGRDGLSWSPQDRPR